MKYCLQTLIDFCNENNIVLCEDYSNVIINARIIIKGICLMSECNNIFAKEFRSIINTNGYCTECTKQIAKEKLKKTWKEKYGVEHISKLDFVNEKVKQTSIKKYGFACSLNNKDVKEKSKATILKKYGVENVSQCKEIQNKSKKTCLEKYGVDSYTKTQDFKEKCKLTSIDKYGVDNYTKTDEFKERYKSKCLEKYGVESYSKSDEFKNKVKKTCQEKYHVDHYSQSTEIKEKIKNKSLEKYGVEHYAKTDEFKERYKSTCLEKYGVDHYTKTDEFKERYKSKCLEKYGVENSSQSTEIMEKIIKSAYTFKTYTFPSGSVHEVQGAEPYALKYLIENENVYETDIVTGCKNVPTIWYIDNKGKNRRHYVDIFIPSQNRCIEVKSTWTEKINRDNIFFKQNAAKKLGYKYEIWVYDGKGEFKNCYK